MDDPVALLRLGGALLVIVLVLYNRRRKRRSADVQHQPRNPSPTKPDNFTMKNPLATKSGQEAGIISDSDATLRAHGSDVNSDRSSVL